MINMLRRKYILMKPKAPCLNCPNRKTLCHSKCEKYKAFRSEMDKINEKITKQHILNADLYYLKNIRNK